MERFRKIYQQGTIDVVEIWVDTQTGVNYVFHRNGNAAGFTPLLDKDGKLPRIKGALMADAVATTVGAVLGTSTTTTFVESASGVTEGGRTGLTSLTTAILFGISLFLSPIFLAIPSFATAPALIIVGFYMLSNVAGINFSDYSEGIPCFICIAAMPFCYSISEGVSSPSTTAPLQV